MQLYDNKQTKIIFATDAEQDPSIDKITPDQIAGLVADGYTVDSSADSFVPATGEPAASGEASASAPAASSDVAPTTGEVAAPLAEAPVADASSEGAAVAPSEVAPVDEGSTPLPVTSALPSGSVGSVTSDTTGSEVTSGEAGEAVLDTSGTGTASTPSTDAATKRDSTSSAASNAAGATPDSSASTDTGAGSPLVSEGTTGTTAAVTQTGDQQVVTGLTQSGNALAGTAPGTGNQLVNSTSTVDAPALDGDSKTFTNVENDLNPLVPAAGTEGAPASQLAAAAAEPAAEPLPRESHLMLMEHKFAALLAKAQNEERIFLADIEAIYAHVKAVI